MRRIFSPQYHQIDSAIFALITKLMNYLNTYLSRLPVILIGISILSITCSEVRAVGATTSFITIEAENATIGSGATVRSLTTPPTIPFSSPEREASGRSFVELNATGESVTITNSTGKSIGAINVRYSIPDAPKGGGIRSNLNLYVNGTFRQTIAMNSIQTWLYDGPGYNGQAQDPSVGHPHLFFDEIAVKISGAAIAPGSTIKLQKDSANTAAFYHIDCVDIEPLPAPLTQPANSLSIISYGAVANNSSVDSLAAIQSCVDAAISQGKSVWIPTGTFYIKSTRGVYVNSPVRIEGAGMWHSVIDHAIPLPSTVVNVSHFNSNGATIRNMTLDNSTTTAGTRPEGAAGGIDQRGSNWVIENIWFKHTSSGVWGSGTNGIVKHCRANNTWGDGINLNNLNAGVGSNLRAEHNFIRGSGDDCIALNSVNYNGTTTYIQMQNCAMVNNTCVAPWWANCMRIAGGINAVAKDNLLNDGAKSGGISIGIFGVNGSPLDSGSVTGNVMNRCGGYSADIYPALRVGSSLGNPDVRDVYVGANTINNSLYDAITISSSSGVTLQNNVVNNPRKTGISIESSTLGSVAMNSNKVNGVASGQVAYHNESVFFSPRRTVQAASYNAMSGTITTAGITSEGCTQIQNITNGSYITFNHIDLRNMTTFVARAASGSSGGNIQIRHGSPTGTLLGTCTVSNTGGWSNWDYFTCNLSPITNDFKTLYLVFTGGGGGLMNLEWFSLSEDIKVQEASTYNAMTGGITTGSSNEGGSALQNIGNGSYTSYNGVKMDSMTHFYVRAASASSGGNIEIRLDSATGTLIGTCTVPSTGGWSKWQTYHCVLTPTTGVHTLYLKFTGSGGALMNISYFQLHAGPFLSAPQIAGAGYNSVSGGIGLEGCSEGGQNLKNILNGSYVVYKDVNLTGVKKFNSRVASASGGGNIEIRLNSPTGTLIGTCTVSNSGGWQNWQTKTCPISTTTGYHDLYLVNTGGSGGLYNLQWFQLAF